MKKNNFKLFSSIALIGILFFTVFFVRLFMLKKSIYPNGLDGFYYALQAKSFSENLVLENPDIECGYYLCGLCSKIFGDPILGVKIWSAFSSSLLSLSIFILVWVLLWKSPNRFLISLFAFVFSSTTISVSALGINYINNQTGLCFLFLYVSSLVLCFRKDGKKNRGRVFAAIVFFVLSLLSHKVSGIYVLVFTVLFLLSRFPIKNFSRKNLFVLIPIFFFILGTVVFVFVKQFQRFATSFDFPSLPIFSKIFIRTFSEGGFLGAFEISCFFVFAWILFFLLIFKKRFFESALIFVLFFPFWNLDGDMGFRMSVNGFVCGIPLLIFSVTELLLGKYFSKSRIVSKIVLIFLSTVFFVTLFFTPKIYNPKKDPDFGYYKKIVEKIQLDDDSLLIAHLGLNHTYTYYKNLRDCMNWLPDYEIEDEKLWRLAFGANEYRIKSFFQNEDVENKIQRIDENYILIQESLWQKYLTLEDEDIAQNFQNWYNPTQVRPKYIRSIF